MYIKGVNLGNWLVLEKWMNPSLFEGTTAADEYYLPTQLTREVYEARIKMHRSQYISERDFVYIKSLGLNAVRIPVPYFIFGDCPPFIGCVEELDKAFAWAEKYGLLILIDLHTVPGSQNGFDNGGISGVCKWAKEPESIEFAITALERLAKRYGNRKGLWGIQILNEPITEKMWKAMDVPNRYKAVDEDMAKESGPMTISFLKDFYIQTYRRIRKYLPEDKVIVIHDAFEAKEWKNYMCEEEFVNVVLDIHLYLMLAEIEGCEQTAAGYEQYIKENFSKEIEEMSEHFPVICGEWSLFNSAGCGEDTKGGQNPLGSEVIQGERLSDEEKRNLYGRIAKAQLAAWEKGSGYFYWNYKLLLDTANDTSWIGWDAWDYGRCVANQWIML
ncbi:MAG: cellulase family glycosylhydrolase [Ruminococcus sp.]|nr:cellulase family glycosylhydrolase [Ruminococcus sp.]